MRITEIEPGSYRVTWRVPTVLRARTVPRPLLPEGCEPVGEQSVTSQPGAWVFERTWTCGAPITGREIGIEYPFGDLALTTVARVDLLSGDRFARVISPGDPAWRLPEGTATPDQVGLSADAALAGVSHAFRSPVHLVFIVVAAALGLAAAPLVITGFTAGQLVGVGLTAGPILPVAIAAGLAHGLAVGGLVTSDLGGGEAGLAASIIAALGTDAAHLVGVGVLFGIAHLLARVGLPDRAARSASLRLRPTHSCRASWPSSRSSFATRRWFDSGRWRRHSDSTPTAHSNRWTSRRSRRLSRRSCSAARVWPLTARSSRRCLAGRTS